MSRDRRFRLGGRGLGVVIGAVLGLCAALVIHQIVPRSNANFALPATIVTALFVGAMAGLMFGNIVVGGQEDDRATHAAHEALTEQAQHDRARRPTSDDRPLVGGGGAS